MPEITCLSAPVSALSSGLDENKMSRSINGRFTLCSFPPHHHLHHLVRHVYDNVGPKGERHIYENDGELRDATPDLILAVKPKVPLEDEQVRDGDERTSE